jgi:hypothetical protein
MNKYKVGTLVERNIEDIWFKAVIRNIDRNERELTLQYCDDDNIEENVPYDEIRIAEESFFHEDHKEEKYDTASAEKENYNSHVKRNATSIFGANENDQDAQSTEVKPSVIIHVDDNIDNAIIINGSESRLAVGGGLRALRYLKH